MQISAHPQPDHAAARRRAYVSFGGLRFGCRTPAASTRRLRRAASHAQGSEPIEAENDGRFHRQRLPNLATR
ncbi:MAG: hypothetical protein ACK4V1_09335, partial [Burkholderiaceae bacterium]